VYPNLNSTNSTHLCTWRTNVIVIVISTMILALGGCNTINPRHNSPVVSQPVATSSSVQNRDPRIQQLLEEAYFAFIESRLTTPIEDNAYYRYLQVLAIDPANEDANRGISNIVEQYLDWSLESLSNRNFRAATNYLNKARSVDESHPNIAAVETRIADYSNASEETYLLDRTGLKNKSPATRDELAAIALRIQETSASIIISAQSDAEGRWIYQQLNDQTANRVKAQFEQRSKPGIRLIIP